MSSNAPLPSPLGMIDTLVDRVGDTTQALFAPLSTPTVRIGVTGLSRSGKTVFITSLINNILEQDRLPKLSVLSEERLEAAVIDDQPDGALPRFPYEKNIDGLHATPPNWPASTDRISQLRIKVRYRPASALKRALSSTATLNVDLVDYPGEWLLDLPMMTMSYTEWSAGVIKASRKGARVKLSDAWHREIDATAPDALADERTATRLHEAYRDYLRACKQDGAALSLLQPGRFLQPGDLADSPALTFAPLPATFADTPGRSLYAEMSRRFELYKSRVIAPFFRDHFAKLDRQVVLLDLLGSAAAGADSLKELGTAMTLIQSCLKPGKNGWLNTILFGRKIERVLFAATKADHLPSDQHAALAELTKALMSPTEGNFNYAGAQTETLAVAGLRSTREGLVGKKADEKKRCIIGTPLGADEEQAFYPGQLPSSLPELAAKGGDSFGNIWFEPPADLGQDGRGLPHSRLDDALQFLIGDLVK